ncbi:MAG: PLDc N-terminal domain-containing protein [Deltaproteobacteria bacterium]|nr:PLDc N-terminal domain-containing protein [Deltaproteobacteria bacterium]
MDWELLRIDWLVVADLAVALPLSAHVLLNKRDPRAAALWLTFLWLLPLAGALLYWSFGVNRIARKALRRRAKRARRSGKGEARVRVKGLDALLRVGNSLSPDPVVQGNSVELLRDGDEAYPAMLSAIEGARRTVGFCSYIFDCDETGRRFVDALCGAAARGVVVRLLVDGVGAWGLGPEVRRRLTASGGRMSAFMPSGRWLKHPGINLRNHRKVLVVDGDTGFTGGLNVSSRHVTADGGPHPESRDAHFRVRGPVVRHLSDVFRDDWNLAAGEALEGEGWCLDPAPAGDVVARGVASGPDDTSGRIYELFLGALRAARERVDLMSPYFIPDVAVLEALRVARLAGVRVRLLLPLRTDHAFMNWAARGYLPELVARGVEVWNVGPGFVHSKLAVVDHRWVMLGSPNLDPRSFFLNFEFVVEAFSEPLARDVVGYMESFLPAATRVTAATLRDEPLARRLRNQAVKLFSPFL